MEPSKTIPGVTTIDFEEDRIVKIKMLPNSNIDVEAAKAIFETVNDMAGSVKHVDLVDVREMIFMSREARSYFGNMESKNILAIAILINSIFHNTLMNLYLKFNKPQIITKAFDKEVDALDWLRGKLG